MQAAKRLTTEDAMHLMRLASKSQQQSLAIKLISPKRPTSDHNMVQAVASSSRQVRKSPRSLDPCCDTFSEQSDSPELLIKLFLVYY